MISALVLSKACCFSWVSSVLGAVLLTDILYLVIHPAKAERTRCSTRCRGAATLSQLVLLQIRLSAGVPPG